MKNGYANWHWRWFGYWLDREGGWIRLLGWTLVIHGPTYPKLFSERNGYRRFVGVGGGWRVRVERARL